MPTFYFLVGRVCNNFAHVFVFGGYSLVEKFREIVKTIDANVGDNFWPTLL